jgi:hypothetical protein
MTITVTPDVMPWRDMNIPKEYGASFLSGQMAVRTALSSDTLVMSFTQENAVDHSVLSLNAHNDGQRENISCQKQEYH